ncbi:MAG: NUDIX domain-containing protein [Thiobacillaceae bacterium]|nr:NUDIX domain-containing protein [Thiobacillaceae bacterium]MDW8324213.1 NUDIX domain-containing protein [Burkholderiales bacterium]
MSRDTPTSAGIVVLRRVGGGWRMLLLRAYSDWDFPKGQIEPGETPFAAALRETAEETGLTELSFPWGEVHIDVGPYGSRHKIARYYLGETTQAAVRLPISPELGRPEHHEWRWVNANEAARLLAPRLKPVLAWVEQQLATRS